MFLRSGMGDLVGAKAVQNTWDQKTMDLSCTISEIPDKVLLLSSSYLAAPGAVTTASQQE